MAVMDRKKYMDKVEGLLAQPTFKIINSDPTNKLKAKLKQKLKKIKMETNIEEVCIGPCMLPLVTYTIKSYQ